ncbi:LON peptidase substrate-binding domain-containing protein [Pseudoroseomonas cervicalis]|uniref:ATP-dependent protease La (LON) domain protein n=1 Tax=Pseudoroseomonas cervicalis ATCC 49957 TaxID=525371 RepID=D5RGJ1_9PROT|nr:LON peptidase substrate-binding domain-containing protein [Pseudoroseomonas cervicalis]EFH13605.1 ATP-dependent protease La (LON) domain protein [Pseudoroseomonas cervicalis ATCC 49957]
MDPFQTRPEALPREIPVFPLAGALLLPGGRLPLNIFEPRYLAMVEDALATGRVIGMMLPDPSRPRPGGRSALYRTGCAGRIVSFAETEDGRYLITLRGLLRFAVLEELADSPGGYRRVRADYAPYLADLAPEAAEAAPERGALLGALRPYFATQGIQADWAAIERSDPAALVTSLCMVCPFADPEKQALLEAPDTAARAAMLVALLRMGQAGPAPSSRPS